METWIEAGTTEMTAEKWHKRNYIHWTLIRIQFYSVVKNKNGLSS